MGPEYAASIDRALSKLPAPTFLPDAAQTVHPPPLLLGARDALRSCLLLLLRLQTSRARQPKRDPGAELASGEILAAGDVRSESV